MKISKRQLKRMIREMYPDPGGITLARLEQLTMAHENLVKEIEELYDEIPGEDGSAVGDYIRDTFTELLFPLFQHAEGGSGAPRS
jgi:hypothetical protein